MEFNNININMLDIILFIGILISLIIGYSRGFVKEALSIINWLLAAWLAFKYYSDLKTITLSFIETNIIADAISFGILFLVTLDNREKSFAETLAILIISNFNFSIISTDFSSNGVHEASIFFLFIKLTNFLNSPSSSLVSRNLLTYF